MLDSHESERRLICFKSFHQPQRVRGPYVYSALRQKIRSGELPAELVGREYSIRAEDLSSLVRPNATINTAVALVVDAAPRSPAISARSLR